MQYVIAYDVPEDKRRNRLAKCLLNFGRRIQFSMFLCDLEPKDYLRLCRKVEALMNFTDDRLHIFPLCKACVERAVVRGSALVQDDESEIWLL